MAEAKEKITDQTEVTTTELASVLGLSGRRVQQMVQDGTLVTVRRGHLNLADAVQRYIRFISIDPATEEDVKIERGRRQSEAIMKASKATIAKLEAEELRGNMHRSEDVAAMTEDLVYTMRSMLVALPGRLAVDVASAQTAAEAAEIIRTEVYSLMSELTKYRYDPKKYEERVRERRRWEMSGDDDGEDG